VPRGAAQVTSVVEESPAEEAGLQVGDIIVGVDGNDLADEVQLRTIIGNHRPGDTVELSIIRDERRRDVEVTLALRDPDMLADGGVPPPSGDSSTMEGLGLSLGDLNAQALEAAGIDPSASGLPKRGAIVTRIDQSSPAYRDAELRNGDIITEVDKKQISGRAEFEQVYREMDSGDAVIIRAARVLRGAEGMETQSFLTALTKP
jgi:serine protease Do